MQRVFGLLFVAVLGSGCLKWFSDKVGTGVARLAVRNFGAVATLISNDETCGFASAAVQNAVITEGDVGGYGVATWTVTDCVIDIPERYEVKRDCQDEVVTATGKVTVSAQKIVYGRLTGDLETPVVPEQPDAATIELVDVSFKDFQVKDTKSDSYMNILGGSGRATIKPMLTKSIEKGVCSISTPNVWFEGVSLKGTVEVTSPDRTFETDVDGMNLVAQNGRGEEYENYLKGAIIVFGKNEEVPRTGDNDGLDPDYATDKFEASYACTDDMVYPLTHECDPTPTLAQGASRLTIKMLGTLVRLIADDTTCGFDSPEVKAHSASRGEIGDDGGEVTFSLGAGCTLDLSEPYPVMTDCNDVTTYVRGKATVFGTKKVIGFVTGDPETPVVPTSRDAASVSINARLEDFEVFTSEGDKSFLVRHGNLRGTMAPRLALDTESGACTISTPVATFSGVVLDNAEVRVVSEGKAFDLSIEETHFSAQNGKKGDTENELSGSIAIDGRNLIIPVDIDDPRLDPDFHEVLFDEAYQCEENMVVPSSDAQCSFRQKLGEGVARLTLKTFGTIVKHIDDNDECGYGSTNGLIPVEIIGTTNDPGTIIWDVDECTIGGDDAVNIYTDCNDKEGYIQGAATVTSTKTVNGILVLGYPPIEPEDRESVRFTLDAVSFDEFRVFDIKPDETTPEKYLVLHNGTMTGVSRPITGESEENPGAFFIKTPIAYFDDVVLTQAEVTLVSGKKHFNLTVSADLDGMNGAYWYDHNWMAGTVVVDGEVVTVPLDPEDPSLDPEYDQAVFDQSYVCKDDLKELVPASTF